MNNPRKIKKEMHSDLLTKEQLNHALDHAKHNTQLTHRFAAVELLEKHIKILMELYDNHEQKRQRAYNERDKLARTILENYGQAAPACTFCGAHVDFDEEVEGHEESCAVLLAKEILG